MKFQTRNVRKFIAKFVGIILRNWDGPKHLRSRKHVDNEHGVEEVEKKQMWMLESAWKYTGEKMLLAILAWGIGKAGQRRMRRKLGSWIRITGMNIRRRKRCITKGYSRLEIECEMCRVRKCNWARHLGTRKHMLGGGGGKVDGHVGGGGGWDEGKAWPSHYS